MFLLASVILFTGGGGLPLGGYTSIGGWADPPPQDTWDTTGYGQHGTHPTGILSCLLSKTYQFASENLKIRNNLFGKFLFWINIDVIRPVNYSKSSMLQDSGEGHW